MNKIIADSLLLLIMPALSSSATDYCVDGVGRNDGNTGICNQLENVSDPINRPWQHIARVSRAPQGSGYYMQGDTINFGAGQVFESPMAKCGPSAAKNSIVLCFSSSNTSWANSDVFALRIRSYRSGSTRTCDGGVDADSPPNLATICTGRLIGIKAYNVGRFEISSV